ncbi:MAG: acyl-ACP desaturase [Cellulophaga sp.]|uniref:acyl-ACP desaturase n=1 Tax=unclassified Cellulophaga TaxID=2634405 RepID=UPI000C2BBAD9|nr:MULTISPECIES: acyl-ACP desaturase [unclassified Cellulophaga]MDO6491172.1 acyl-ACP desaturase [Cellulophaga sp. 2_MG-2023]MDO6495295.1 acyl-ACP desaturase [Cellulophaga sp. 3_MG-2023]PKB42859.1 acyl-[acyl-carrier-protein] desaturase [Cellulophaga sp. RHA19]
MSAHNIRLEVMKAIESKVEGFIDSYLVPIEKIWQPTDFLPDSQSDNFFNEVEQIREEAKELGYDFWVTLVADTITEEALPTYESWLMDVEGVDQHDGPENGWSKWVRNWTAEENRHGDVLNKYLYLSGRVNMREVEITTQHLIADGFDIGTDRDPYKNFVYTSFQELATNISHKRVGQMAKKKGNVLLGKMCNIIAGDEMRHHLAYREFVKVIMDQDPNGMILAFADMMKRKIVMPAHFLRESGGSIGTAFETFSNCAQRLGVYTAQDYIEILSKLNGYWDIENLRGLNDSAEKARDYLTKLPSRLQRISDRMKIDDDQYHFKWVQANGML